MTCGSKVCAICAREFTRRPGERANHWRTRGTCSTECAYKCRAQTNSVRMTGFKRPELTAEYRERERQKLAMAERICAAPYARQVREYEQAGADARRLFAPDIRSFMEGSRP